LLFLNGYSKIDKQRKIKADFSVNICDYAIVPFENSDYNGILKIEVENIDGINEILWSKISIPVPQTNSFSFITRSLF